LIPFLIIIPTMELVRKKIKPVLRFAFGKDCAFGARKTYYSIGDLIGF
jgi:hypothetical protein